MKLTDDELAALESNARQNDGQVEKWLDLRRALSIIIELRALRAALPTAEEREVLMGVRIGIQNMILDSGQHVDDHLIAALDRLLAASKEQP